jgi:hypothetical protein
MRLEHLFKVNINMIPLFWFPPIGRIYCEHLLQVQEHKGDSLNEESEQNSWLQESEQEDIPSTGSLNDRYRQVAITFRIPLSHKVNCC